MTKSKPLGLAYFLLFISTIYLANWLILHVGLCPQDGEAGPCVIPVWPWPLLFAPSGVLAIGLGFTLRDLVQRHLGARFSMLGIMLGAVLSSYLSPQLALASGAAFLLSETLDLVVYTPLQKKSLTWAVVLSNAVGLVVDSVVFLFLAFGSLDFLLGQVVGKAWMTALALPVIKYARRKDW